MAGTQGSRWVVAVTIRSEDVGRKDLGSNPSPTTEELSKLLNLCKP